MIRRLRAPQRRRADVSPWAGPETIRITVNAQPFCVVGKPDTTIGEHDYVSCFRSWFDRAWEGMTLFEVEIGNAQHSEK